MRRKILIVEDKDKEIQIARKIAEEMGFEVSFRHCAVDCKFVCEHQADGSFKPLVDGVVTDVFIPFSYDINHVDNKENPCGVLIALAAMAAGVPVVFCTSEYHHSAKGQWISSSGLYTGISYIDRDHAPAARPEEERKHKPWRLALIHLQDLMEKKKQGV